MVTSSTTPVIRPAGERTKSATATNMRVGSGSSASNPSKKSANRGMANSTMISTTPSETRQQDDRIDERLAHGPGQFDVATDVGVELAERLVHLAGQLGGGEQRHEVRGEDVGVETERFGE